MWYNLLFQPLVSIFQNIYLALVALTRNHLGLSLILLSVVMSVLLRPFMAWAARMQDKERKIQAILTPQIAEIRRDYRGAEQHAALSALYKRYGYNPLYALRSGMGLFIQLPFLMAAYAMLSSLEILRGQAFWGVADLSRPDGLLWGVNLLPLVMTGINVLATLTARNFSRRERAQAFVIAGLFLLLLYSAPSALLIYWT
ncbi:MAG: YidC/Oxa1 family membrane protein insertase, partial [Fretibacterium sp.]|nr:YidC/Oxa1 family membrane protein insertase [Fretibacterium sp.]